MKWFIDPSRYPTDYALLVSPPVIAGFAFALAAVALAYVVQHRAPEPRWAKQLERYAGFGPLALGVFVGVALMAAALEGLLFVPSLRVTADAEGAGLRLAEFAIGAALALGAVTRPAAVGLALLGAIAMVPFSLESILEQVHLLGAAICLFVVGRGPIAVDALFGQRRSLEHDRGPQLALVVLRIAMGFGIAYNALTEKLLDPALSVALLQQRPELNVLRQVEVSDPQFVYLAGLVELVIGVVIMSGQLTRPAMAVGAVLFTMTLPLFGWLELLGHLPFYGMMLTLFLAPYPGSPRVREQLRAGKLAA
ncbi:MAG: DoxX family membrane protein [Chloroflexi bacterium]|nr:MAG: DoxX family membrane protein [Chloroflexota bacterium]TMC34325.1 MAG: DoxX family membrane protein [Chloroflexota bacterium]TMC56219.1 MAG: DoxX family membrane protein [Chloroflexota bacterium]